MKYITRICTKNTNNFDIIFFSLLILSGLFLRLGNLDKYIFSNDEYWHLYISNADNIAELFKNIFNEEVHPPLSFLIWFYALKISHNELWLRMFSIIPGLLLIPSIYVFGRLYVGRNFGYILSALVTFSSIMNTLSVFIRAYSMLLLIMCWMAIFVYRYINKPKNKYLIYYFFIGFLAIQTHHGVCFFISALAIALIFDSFFKKNKKHLFIIIFGHFTLCSLVLLHLFLLINIFDFSPNQDIYEKENLLSSFINAILKINIFEVKNFYFGEINKNLAEHFDAYQLFSFVIITFLLIKKRKWLLLNILFLPIFLNCITSILKIYPVLDSGRRISIYYINLLIFIAYHWYIFFSYISKKLKLIFIDLRIIILILLIPLYYYVCKHNYLKNNYPNCFEYMEKEDENLFYQKIDSYVKEDGNILVLNSKTIWKYKFLQEGKIEKISKNVAILHKENYKIFIIGYFEREGFLTDHFLNEFYNALKIYDKNGVIKSITFGDFCYDNYNCNVFNGNYKNSENFQLFRNINLKYLENKFSYKKHISDGCKLNILFYKFNKKIINEKLIK
ncbi:MAG: glycosyltransferase family 39 protein [Rickettsiales bacterium]